MYWIQNEHNIKLAIVPRPRGADWLADEIQMLRNSGIDVLVSLLTENEADELGLRDEGKTCESAGIVFVSFPIADRGVPSARQSFQSLIDHLKEDLLASKSIGIHCRQSIGRSSLLAAAVLCSLGSSVDAAFMQIEQSRGCPVPDTQEQREWVRSFANQ